MDRNGLVVEKKSFGEKSKTIIAVREVLETYLYQINVQNEVAFFFQAVVYEFGIVNGVRI